MDKINIKQLYVDMDNVLVDFDTRVKTILFNKWNKEEGYASKAYADAIRDGLFLNLNPMPDMYDLWQTVENSNPILLTSVAVVHPEIVAMDKRRWVDKHIGEHIEIITVSHSGDKAKYAVDEYSNPNLLIDDWDRAYAPFIMAGGRAIPHINAETTIHKLNNYYGIRDIRLSEYK